jgi:hypothetical protein
VAVELPQDVHHAHVRADIPEGGKLQPHRAVLEHVSVPCRVLFLDLLATSPPHPGHVDEISIFGKTGSETAHVMAVPCSLDLIHQPRNVLSLHHRGS